MMWMAGRQRICNVVLVYMVIPNHPPPQCCRSTLECFSDLKLCRRNIGQCEDVQLWRRGSDSIVDVVERSTFGLHRQRRQVVAKDVVQVAGHIETDTVWRQ